MFRHEIGVLSQSLLPRKPDGLVAAYEMMVVTPAIQNLAADYKVCQVNIDNNPGLAGRFQVNAVPTLLVFRGGRMLKRIEGAVPEAHLRAELQAADRA